MVWLLTILLISKSHSGGVPISGALIAPPPPFSSLRHAVCIHRHDELLMEIETWKKF